MTLREYVVVLRQYEGPKCEGSYIDGEKCCALGVIVKLRRPDAANYGQVESEVWQEVNCVKRAALDFLDVNIAFENDVTKLTFKQLADLIESKMGESL